MEIFKFSKSGGCEILDLSPAIKTGKDLELLRKVSALIRYHFKIDPDKLTDIEFSEMWQQLKYALHFESKRLSGDGKTDIHL